MSTYVQSLYDVAGTTVVGNFLVLAHSQLIESVPQSLTSSVTRIGGSMETLGRIKWILKGSEWITKMLHKAHFSNVKLAKFFPDRSNEPGTSCPVPYPEAIASPPLSLLFCNELKSAHDSIWVWSQGEVSDRTVHEPNWSRSGMEWSHRSIEPVCGGLTLPGGVRIP